MIDKKQIVRIYGTEYKDMTHKVLEKCDLASLISDKGLRIGIKPNLVTPTPADYGATTHPEIVAGIVEYLQANGFEDITILEGSWIGDKTSEAFEMCGYNRLSEEYGVKLFDTQKDSSVSVDCGDGVELNICRICNDIDFLINVPVLKGHCQTKMTCALKNLKGLISNSEKRRFHTMGLHTPIAYLQKAIHQDFIVVDHICGDLDFEEGGNPVTKNCIMAGIDPLLIDSMACDILGYSPSDIGYMVISQDLDIGSTNLDPNNIITIGDAASTADETNHRRLLDVSYAAEEVDSCSACYASLTGALLRLSDEGLLSKLKTPISIGQGFRGKSGYLGIGACTSNFEISIPGCPPDEDTIYESLKSLLEEK